MKEDIIATTGQVVDKHPSGSFIVQINNTEYTVLATISNKLRKNQVRITIGDSVDIELSPHDNTKGRITRRHE